MKEVLELSGESRVNKYLALGWKLLAIAPVTTESRDSPVQVFKYSLGWDGEGLPLHPGLRIDHDRDDTPPPR